MMYQIHKSTLIPLGLVATMDAVKMMLIGGWPRFSARDINKKHSGVKRSMNSRWQVTFMILQSDKGFWSVTAWNNVGVVFLVGLSVKAPCRTCNDISLWRRYICSHWCIFATNLPYFWNCQNPVVTTFYQSAAKVPVSKVSRQLVYACALAPY